MADAVVHIGPFDNSPGARGIIRRFYEKCGREVIGPARIATGDILLFDTLEELIDHMQHRSERFHVVVCHGNSTEGILVPFTREAPRGSNATGLVIDALASLGTTSLPAKVARGLPLTPGSGTDEGYEWPLVDVASKMQVPYAAAARLVAKLAAVRPGSIEFRGCHLAENDPNLSLLRSYKNAFHALSLSAPDARMFYLGMVPGRPRPPATIASMATATPGGKTRRRVFQDTTKPPLADAGPLILDVTDLDGHTRVRPEATMDAPAKVVAWASEIDGAWSGSAGDGFVTQVIWVDSETSYHTPWDVSFRAHLKRV
jgi:hypothetical protein